MTAVNLNRALRGPVTAVPVVAGKGVRIVPDVENNRFVVEADETVLWEGSPENSSSNIVISNKLLNYERVLVYWKSYERRYVSCIFAGTNDTMPIVLGEVFVNPDGNYEKSLTRWGSSNGLTYTWEATIHGAFAGTQTNTWNSNIIPLKIVGINRIAGGN